MVRITAQRPVRRHRWYHPGEAHWAHHRPRSIRLLPDTHAHLDAPEFDADLEAVIARAEDAGVDRILAVGSDLVTSRRAVALAHRFPCVYAAVGVHPYQAASFRSQASDVYALLNADKVVAVGEIGLDYLRDDAPRSEQREAFAEQLRWAEEHHLPVSIHNRGADSDVVGALSLRRVTAVLHCFSDAPALLQSVLGEGHYISFAGNLTFPKAQALRSMAGAVPLDRVLVETDAPVLTPQPWRGKRNEPAYVVAVAGALAALHGLQPVEIQPVVTANADRIFCWRVA